MNSTNQNPGFFPNLFSVGVFTFILGGLFLVFTSLYPQLIARYHTSETPVITPEQTVSEQIAPFVRGITSGIAASQSASSRDNQPLNVNLLRGYESGIKTALLASKNWYNLDQQLFRVRGIAIGLASAEETSKTERQRGTQAYQVRLIQQISAALSVNLDELLSSNTDNREEVLRNYLTNLKQLAGEAAIEVANLQRIIAEATAEVETQTGIAQQYDEDFLYNLEPTDDRNIEAYLRSRNQIDQSTITIRSAGQLLNQLGPLYNRLNQLITSIEANFQALAAGIRVAPTQGVNLPIFQEQ